MTNTGMGTKQKHVKITSNGVRGTIVVDGVDISHEVVGYQAEHHAGQLPTVVLVLRPHADSTLFDGMATVGVASPEAPGEAIAAFLGSIDPAALDRAALGRDLDGSSNELTKAMLAQLADWARGKTGE